jgi:hypothetical protein
MTGHVDDQLAYYHDLTPTERHGVDAHVAECSACRATLAIYREQDAALRALPTIRSARDLRPRQTTRSRSALTLFGDALALAGLAAFIWLFALQWQVWSQGGRLPASPPDTGVTLPPSSIQLPSPWIPALPWVGGALLLVGGLFVVSPRNRRLPLAGAIVAAFLLLDFIPPFSALPNPVGVYWRIRGGYAYDPRLPFANEFIMLGRPENDLQPYLRQLIGQVGLSPLDPVQPLARYEILRVSLHPHHNRVALVTTRFIYADGSSRIYPIPLFTPASSLYGLWLGGWMEDGLERLRSEHLALPGQPFATEASAIHIGPARLLDLHPAANRLDEVNPGHWLWNSVRVQRLVWAPDGQAFLAAMEVDPGVRQLWRVPLDGSPPSLIASGDIREYGWSPDGQLIVFTRLDPEAQVANRLRPFAIASAVTQGEHVALKTIATALGSDKLPGLTSQGVWFFSEGSLWRMLYDGSPPQPWLTDVVTVVPNQPPRPAPDESRIAYTCRARVFCMADARGKLLAMIPMQAAEATWSPDGARLAVIDRDPNNLRPVRLVILSRDGAELLAREIAPHDATDAPAWTLDGSAVFVQTYPQDGRRIIAVDIASGQVLDLSQEHWDTYFALSPDGRTLLLNNGRGNFWTADVLR